MTTQPLDTEKFIIEGLGTDNAHVKGDWRNRLLGTDPARVVAATPDDRCTTLRMTHEFAYRVSQVAASQGMTRAAYIRKAVTRQVEADLGLEPGTLDGQMLPRRRRRTRGN